MELTKSRTAIKRRARKTENEIAVFKEPPHIMSISLGMMCLGAFLIWTSLGFLVNGGFMLTIIGLVAILIALKLATMTDRLNAYLDPKKGRVRIVQLTWFKSVELRTLKRSEIAEARVLEDRDFEGDLMFGAELLLTDGTTVPLTMCKTSHRIEWEKKIGQINEILGKR